MNIKNAVTDKANAIMGIPESIFTDDAVIEILGMKKVRVENHLGIIKYSPEEILMKTTDGTLKIIGKAMRIESVVAQQTVVCGEIFGVVFIT